MLLSLAALGLLVQGCATQNVNPPQARPNTGYVDIHAGLTNDLSWEVTRWDDRLKSFQSVFWDLDPPSAGVLRLAFPPGRQRLRIALLNRAITRPVEAEVEVQDGKVSPLQVTLSAAGTTIVQTKEQSRGGTPYGRYGRRTKFGSDETTLYELSTSASPPVAYQLKERMPYAH